MSTGIFFYMQHKTAIKVITGFFLLSFLFQEKEIGDNSAPHHNCSFATHTITTTNNDPLNNLTNPLYLLLTSTQHNLFSENEDTQPSKKGNETITNHLSTCTSKKQKQIYLQKIILYSATRHKNLILPKIGVLKT